MASATATVSSQALRVAAVWGTTVIDLRTLKRGESFTLVDDGTSATAMPDGVDMSPTPLFFGQGGWELDARGAVGGVLRLRGREEDPAAIGQAGAPIAVVPGDYGLLQYGIFSIFFQYTTQAPPVGGGVPFELLVILALFSSSVLHAGVLGMVRALMTPDPLPKPLELTNPDEYAARFGLHRAMIEPPPPPVAGNDKGSGVKDPGAKDKTPPGGGAKMKGAEGKLGLKGPADHLELQAPPHPAENLGGLSDVLNSDAGEEIKHTLSTINNVAAALNGLNSANVMLGGGTGTGLKGGGSGGGGTGAGVAFGAGTLQTGWGAGNGGGYGGGTGGPGAAGSGGYGRGGSGGGPGTGTAESRVVMGNQALASAGGLTPEQVRRVVVVHEGALRACYESEAQRNPNLRGGVTVAWQIDASGGVTTASLGGSTLNNQRVEGCIVRQVKAWHFPSSNAPTTVGSYPFRFGVGG